MKIKSALVLGAGGFSLTNVRNGDATHTETRRFLGVMRR